MLITNLTGKKAAKKQFAKAAEAVFCSTGREIADLNLVLVGEEKIREINAKYRGKNEATDVLSFEGLNEILICPSIIQKQAKNLKTSFESELTRMVVHGILHLLGFDHEKKSEAAKMRKKENEILGKLYGSAVSFR